ncbi:hypothetical protein CCHR01_09805 [Colletotrichum chrysophilum]|uniref:Uncharacterized protein n=1 Tax=Colletotrichum chrysophilum TaxID=1836956 RepID=A0AAD9EHE7_9PEZI|nr:hypothetical protein CCHR01_09805 [Colletotrichum chrysophilum]
MATENFTTKPSAHFYSSTVIENT